MTDEDIIHIFFGTKGRFKRNTNKLLENDNEITEYLKNRYADAESLLESVYRIHYHIEERPTCKICGGKVEFRCGKNVYAGKNFMNCCSEKCKNEYRALHKNEAIFAKFGVDNVWRLPEVKEKIRNTVTKHYGGFTMQSPILRQIAEQTNLERYGVKNPFASLEIQEKIKQTNLERYGAENPFGSDIIRERYERKCLGGKSKQEDYCYELLTAKFNKVIRQYKSNDYPWRCDFYIPSIDTYIEYNGFFTHGEHPFDENNPEDIETLNYVKSIIDQSSLYKAFIICWTISDPLKRSTAKQNNLNYVEFWNLKEAQDWINSFELS